MINKHCFIRSIKKIEDFREDQRKATIMLHNTLNMDGNSVLTFGDQLVDEIIELLSMSFDSGDNVAEMEDIEDWITWYLYKNTNIEKQVTINKKEYVVKNIGDLYDIIIKWKKYKGNV